MRQCPRATARGAEEGDRVGARSQGPAGGLVADSGPLPHPRVLTAPCPHLQDEPDGSTVTHPWAVSSFGTLEKDRESAQVPRGIMEGCPGLRVQPRKLACSRWIQQGETKHDDGSDTERSGHPTRGPRAVGGVTQGGHRG